MSVDRGRVSGWLLFVLAAAVCVAIGYGAYTLAGISWDAVVSYRSPYASARLPEAEKGSALASRTVLVIIDGLRSDAAADMGTFSAVRSHGSSMTLTAPQPSLSYPNWTTILTGAPPYVSGVTTNWHEGKVPVESIFDTAKRAGVSTVFVGPEDFETLFGVREKTVASFMKVWDKKYLSTEYVDAALSLAKQHRPELLIVHLPDVDEAGHDSGGESGEYSTVASKVDADLGRLVDGLQDGKTTFVLVADHGHIDTGGHGGWEADVVSVPLAMAGPGAMLASGTGDLESVAPSVGYLTGAPVPRYASESALRTALGPASQTRPRMKRQLDGTLREYAAIVSEGLPASEKTNDFAVAKERRLARDRSSRLVTGLAGLAASLAAVALVGLFSRRILAAASVGTAAYYAIYNLLFFVVHGNRWSLSAFNSEDLVKSWMNTRLVEAAAALLVAAAVAAFLYPLVGRSGGRRRPGTLPGWLSVGPATALVVLATLGLQVAWFVWAWGVAPVWRLPDLMWGFKYDIDLIQATAVGFAAVVAPLACYAVMRVHPAAGTPDDSGGDREAGAPVPSEPKPPLGASPAEAEVDEQLPVGSM